jgi:hypothetical protein
MDEYTALAQQVAVGDGDISACLILSRDGMLLGAYPAADEVETKLAWLRFSALGEPQRGFVEFPDRIWAFVHRGPYAAFAVASPSARPGLLMDRIEQALFVAEEARTKHEPMKLGDPVSEPPTAPSSKPRTPLHPPVSQPAEARVEVPVGAAPEPVVIEAAEPPTSAAPPEQPADRSEAPTSAEPPERAADPPEEAAPAAPTPEPPPSDAASPEPPAVAVTPVSNLRREPQRLVTSGDDGDDEAEVDRVLLAKEFSGLLQVDDDPDDASS